MALPRKIKVITEVKNEKLISNRDQIEAAVKMYEGKQVEFSLGLVFKSRSEKENRYYWGVIVEHWKNLIREEWGEIWSKEDVHHFLKTNLNYEELVDDATGLILRKPKSTTENSTLEQENFHKACRNLAWNMFECHIPLPNEKLEAEFK
jgi:hypothetical protein